MMQDDVSDYTFRVKTVYLDPVIIESFCSEGVFFTSSKGTSNVVELDSDCSSDDSGGGDDLHAD